jgi:hypothetical protein
VIPSLVVKHKSIGVSDDKECRGRAGIQTDFEGRFAKLLADWPDLTPKQRRRVAKVVKAIELCRLEVTATTEPSTAGK